MGFATEKRILVAYASRYGSTAEVAMVIGEVLHGGGFEVEVRSAGDIKDAGTYQAVILGSSTRHFHLLPEAVEFARRNRSALVGMPTAYFVTGLMLKFAMPKYLDKAKAILDPLREIKAPVATAFFHGKLETSRLEWSLRFYFRRFSPIVEGDYRDWDAVRKWAAELAGKLQEYTEGSP